MGGNAFNKILPASSFPRILPPVYHALKSRLTPVLERLYLFVATPLEAPEKPDFGDLDFTVAQAKVAVEGQDVNVPHDVIQTSLGALHAVPMPGNRTSSYAVPMTRVEWEDHGLGDAFDKLSSETDSSGLFYQVDVHVSTDVAEARRVVFFNGYGDLGMIMGLVAANNGLKVSPHGLKMPNGIWKPVTLCEDMDEVMDFMGFDGEVRARGFQTKQQIFEWVGQSRFFDARQFRSKGEGISKVKEERTMYGDFVKWAEEQRRIAEEDADSEADQLSREDLKNEWATVKDQRKEEALVRFGKKDAYDAEMRVVSLRAKAKTIFNGNTVKEWTGLADGQWEELRLTMHIAKRNMRGEEGIWDIIEKDGEGGVKLAVLGAREEVQAEMKIKAQRDAPSDKDA